MIEHSENEQRNFLLPFDNFVGAMTLPVKLNESEKKANMGGS